MRPFKIIVLGCLVAVMVYSLLVIRWPGVRSAYRNGFLSVGQALFGEFGSEGLTIFRASRDADSNHAEIMLGKRGVDVGQPVRIHTGQVGFVPTALTIALVVATPLSWRRKATVLVIAMALIHLFIVARVWLLLLFSYSNNVPYRLYEPSPWLAKLLERTTEFVFFAPACSFLAPIVIWAAVALHPGDLAAAFRSTGKRAGKGG